MRAVSRSERANPRQLEAIYKAQVVVLTGIATSLDVPDTEAEELAHQALLASLRHLPKIANLDTWLRASITYAAQHRAGA